MIQPYNINIPNPGEEMLAGIQAGQNYMIKHKAQQRQADMQVALANLAQKKDKTVDDFQQVMTQYPEISKQIEQSLGQFNDQQKQARINQIMPIHMALSSGNKEVAINQIDELISAYHNSNNEMEAKSLEILKSNIELDPKGAETSSELLLMKALGPDAFQKYLQKTVETKLESQKSGLKGRIQPHTETTPDGTVWSINDKGDVTVKDISGKVLEGEEAKKAWIKGKEYGVDIAKRTNFGRESGKLEAQKDLKSQIAGEVKQAEAAVKKSSEFFDKYEKIQENITTLDEGIKVIEAGLAEGKDLGVGPIRRFFPRWGATANNLRNVANRLGLDVVSSVTFGALSAKELEMATQTAMPTGLKGNDLLKWLKNRKATQEKLSSYLSEAAQFIGSPKEGGGVNTAADWMAYNEEKKKQASKEDITNISTADLIKQFQAGMR